MEKNKLTVLQVLATHAAVTNKHGLYTARFFLGMMEAGLFPGLAAQVSFIRASKHHPLTYSSNAALFLVS